MMEYVIIGIVAFLTAILTFFSGFGLGTLLLPAFALFFPVEMAVAMTGVVHLFNNLFKLFLIGRHANRDIIIKFGIPALISSGIGAFLLIELSQFTYALEYFWMGKEFQVTYIKMIIGLLLIFFAILEIFPKMIHCSPVKGNIFLGGLLSGFFGGLSGHQGALRSAFLIHMGMDKESFIGTSIVIACLVDVSRLGVYFGRFWQTEVTNEWPLILLTCLFAFSGAWIGNKLLKKVTMYFLHKMVATLLILIGLALSLGWI